MSQNNAHLSRYARRALLRKLLLGPLLLSGCAHSAKPEAAPTALPRPRPAQATLIALTPTQATAADTSPPAPTLNPASPESPASLDSGWLNDGEDLELRHVRIERRDGNRVPLVIVRLDPQAFAMRIAYDSDKPRLLRNWLINTQATLAINGGFFLENYQPVGLIVSDGVTTGESYQGFGGMLSLSSDGALQLRALRDQPYDPNIPLEQAVQSFPMLVFPDAQYANFEDNGQKARRTAVAFDQRGRLLIIVAPGNDLSLRELADWLQASDLEIERALNLDGGPSTGLFLHSSQLNEQIDSLAVLPIVLLFNQR